MTSDKPPGHPEAGNGSETGISAARPHVLVTGAGTGRANNLIRSLQSGPDDIEVTGCNHDPFLLRRSDAAWSFRAPEPSDPAFAAACRPIVESRKIHLIIPSSDEDALALARIADALPCPTYLPPAETIEICQDKFLLYQVLRSHNVPVPETFAVRSREDVVASFRRLDRHPLLWCRMRHGSGSKGATKVKDAVQAWSWITYWNEMRQTAIEEFTLSEYLPGRDYNVQGLWQRGENVLIKMCERLSYLDGQNRPSGMSSTPALAKTLCDDQVLDLCDTAIRTIAPKASGVFNLDVKEDARGHAKITEINAGRFAMITNLYDFTGQHNMVQIYVRMALGRSPGIDRVRDIEPDQYLIREYDSQPLIAPLREIRLE
jgi:predicted ATP-grasp superfamily ATP-dependent carboligase